MNIGLHSDCCRIDGDIRYCEVEHSYTHLPSQKRLHSVSKVIQRVYSTKTWDGADMAVVENARFRGEAVDRHLARYVREGRIEIKESPEVAERLVIAHRIWEQQFGGSFAEAQKIVFSLEDGIAGTLDFDIEGDIIADLKCTYSVEPSWVLQLGAYATYRNAKRGGIIHVSPKTYREGGRWLEYDMDECRRFWLKAMEWWAETVAMEKFGRKR